jgi:phosphate acetyltransferase
MSVPAPAAAFMAAQVERLRRIRPGKRIVFPEGDDPRILAAAERLASEHLAEPILIREQPAASRGVTFISPMSSAQRDKYAAIYYERRRAKGITRREAEEIALRPLYFADLMVEAGDADASVGGAANSTADTVRAALHSLGTAPQAKLVSSVFLMALPDRKFGHNGLLAFADCAIVIDPGPAELADIAISTARTVRTLFETEPIVALLSFSTKGSGSHRTVDKVVEALKIVKARAPDLNIDGELQADAALVPAVGRSKAPGSTVAGLANTLIFPDLNAANIGYKLVERLAGAAAIGPFLQGLAKPANDLSRGCSAEDAYHTAIITALQAESVKLAIA